MSHSSFTPVRAAALLIVAAMLLPLAACAQDGSRAQRFAAKAQQRFDAADTNHDGMISRDEAQQGLPRIAQHFDDVDTNHDGQLSREELGAYLKSLRAARQSG
ncbi:MAG TPA: EF-hand domain-containing protein [Mizugakiibacter sp.]